jgi:hypothetical protein
MHRKLALQRCGCFAKSCATSERVPIIALLNINNFIQDVSQPARELLFKGAPLRAAQAAPLARFKSSRLHSNRRGSQQVHNSRGVQALN